MFSNEVTRREFLKTAGAAAGGAMAASLLPRGVFAAGADTPVIAASAIARPTFAAPAIIRAGEPIPFLGAAGARAKVDALWLQPSRGEGRIDVDTARLADSAPDAAVSLATAAPLAPGMYDIFAAVSMGGKSRVERQPLAVKAVADFKKDFTFGVISDVHFGDSRIGAKVSGFDVGANLAKILSMLNSAGVEFTVCCGDLCFIPPKTKSEIMDYAETVAANANFPVFTAPGNHDGYCGGTPAKVNFDTFKHYGAMGPLSFEASYGGMSIIGVNTYDKPDKLRNLYGGIGEKVDLGAMGAEQLEWLDAALARAAAGDGPTIMLGHHNPTNTVRDKNGMFEVEPFSDAGRAEFLELIKKRSPDVFFVGHVHGIHEETLGGARILTVPTAGSLPAEGFPVGFQIATVSGGAVSKIETVEILRM